MASNHLLSVLATRSILIYLVGEAGVEPATSSV
jgi:hypothetical protein